MVAYYGAPDIPGKNKAQPYPGPTFKEELLCSGTIGIECLVDDRFSESRALLRIFWLA